MSDCDHVVAFVKDRYDPGAWLTTASLAMEPPLLDDFEKKFVYCPLCGMPLPEFWTRYYEAMQANREES